MEFLEFWSEGDNILLDPHDARTWQTLVWMRCTPGGERVALSFWDYFKLNNCMEFRKCFTFFWEKMTKGGYFWESSYFSVIGLHFEPFSFFLFVERISEDHWRAIHIECSGRFTTSSTQQEWLHGGANAPHPNPHHLNHIPPPLGPPNHHPPPSPKHAWTFNHFPHL